MHIFAKRIFIAAAAPLLLTGCLWGPGKFASDLTLKTDGSFVLDYKGEIVLQTPPDAETKAEPWKKEKARCRESGRIELEPFLSTIEEDDEDKVRPCSAEQLAEARKDYETQTAARAVPTEVIVNSSDHRLAAHRFYERLGYHNTGYRFVKPLAS